MITRSHSKSCRLALCVALSISWAISPALAQKPATAPPSLSLPLSKGAAFPIHLPLSFWKGMPAIEAKINGGQSEYFVVSTGFNGLALAPEAISRLQLPPAEGQSRLSILDQTQEANQAQIKRFQLQSAIFENAPIASLDVFALLSKTPRAEGPLGWIGSPVLAAFQVTLDFASQRLTLEDALAPLPKSPDTLVIPFTLKEGRIWVQANVKGDKPFPALLDTSAPGTLIPTASGVTLPTTGQKQENLRRSDGKVGVIIQTSLPALVLGDAEIRGLGAAFISPDSPPEFDRKFAVVGLNFLRYFRVTINYSKRKIALTPVTADPAASQ